MNNVSAIINKMNIKERADGRLEGRITVNGKRKSFYGMTKAEVKNSAKQYLIKVENGYIEPKNVTLSEYMAYWLETYKKETVEPNTYTRLYRVYENQIKTTLGNKKIGDISTKDIQNVINSYAKPKDEDVKPLAKSGLEKIKHLLSPCMDSAIKEGVIQSNPCEDVVIPSENYIYKETKEQFSLTDNQIEEIKAVALTRCENDNKYLRNRVVILLLLNLGLRAGEMLVLEWKDVDLENRIVSINKTLQTGIKDFEGTQGNSYNSRTKKSTKTKSGMRTLPLNDASIHYFNLLLDYDKENGVKSKYVCHTKHGTISNHRNLQKSLDCMVAKTDIKERVTLHTLRHTYGSVLIRNNIRVEVVSKLMGHSSITITYNKYIHTIQEEEAKAMNIVSVC